MAFIEEATRGQRNNPQWMVERTKRLTASNFGEICRATERKDLKKLAARLLSPSHATGPAINHGIQYEPVAVKWYETSQKVVTFEAGIFIDKEMPFIAASPDRVINENLILEVKCPYLARNKNIIPETVPYLEICDEVLALKKDHIYFYQIQGQLQCTGREICHLLVFTLKDKKIVTVRKDEAFIKEMAIKLKSFYDLHFRDMFIEHVFHKRYSQFNFKY